MANGIKLFLTAFLSFSALILAIIACAGSTKNYYPINSIYVAQLDLTNLNIESVLPTLSSTSTSTVFPSYITIGLWSYCTLTSNKTFISCTSPSGIQNFNLRNLLYDNIQDNQVLTIIDSISSIILPSNLQDKIKYYNSLVKCMFITLLIGIITSFLALFFALVRWFIHLTVLNLLAICFSILSFLSLLISAGTSMGTYLYIRRLLNDDDSLGVKLYLGRVYLGIIWGAVVASLLDLIVWSFVRSRRRQNINNIYVNNVETKPLIYS
ncbi:Pun1p NDAI_0J02650 [Naumovozyma dairenensis CBS 421]|uniref:Uncharacterized protein n=1 Tax=Naumovozyma dairenensis (strain ATCC 10597 / BCRC 20456 / CBS 421 / NBRC 0211 / NRRL Y-12639) TaxID=1071378 RepID=G0WH79_NAUDC|nr:hypothetical protein NDAI_0J02650 [Naumovozyma dairenensis CBS 421]CCD27157.1 hypothetical protein NDAI_0J02650 [Naumovozyma dairenensis CBS 421]